MEDHEEEMGEILRKLNSLELRLSKLESILEITNNESLAETEEKPEEVDPLLNPGTLTEEEKGLES